MWTKTKTRMGVGLFFESFSNCEHRTFRQPSEGRKGSTLAFDCDCAHPARTDADRYCCTRQCPELPEDDPLREKDLYWVVVITKTKKYIPIEWGLAANRGIMHGDHAFNIYETKGLPIEAICSGAKKAGLTVDMDGFNAAMERAKAKSRAGSKFKKGVWNDDTITGNRP